MASSADISFNVGRQRTQKHSRHGLAEHSRAFCPGATRTAVGVVFITIGAGRVRLKAYVFALTQHCSVGNGYLAEVLGRLRESWVFGVFALRKHTIFS